MESPLTHDSSSFLNFRRYSFRSPHAHAFRWVNAKRFRLRAPSAGDRRLLAALIGHAWFRDAYAGGGAHADETRHGSYRLDAITPDTYERVGREEGAAVLRMWADRYGEVPDDLEADLRREVFEPLARADGVHHLVGVGEDDFHDWGGVHDEFHEFVLVDRSRGLLTLLVAADD
ncbi:hypothetical protein [Nocardiopsis flavescens]